MSVDEPIEQTKKEGAEQERTMYLPESGCGSGSMSDEIIVVSCSVGAWWVSIYAGESRPTVGVFIKLPNDLDGRLAVFTRLRAESLEEDPRIACR